MFSNCFWNTLYLTNKCFLSYWRIVEICRINKRVRVSVKINWMKRSLSLSFVQSANEVYSKNTNFLLSSRISLSWNEGALKVGIQGISPLPGFLVLAEAPRDLKLIWDHRNNSGEGTWLIFRGSHRTRVVGKKLLRNIYKTANCFAFISLSRVGLSLMNSVSQLF